MSMPLTPNDLIGTWQMVSFVTTFEDGTTCLPYGPRASGRIVYDAGGTMAAHLWDPDRHRPGAPDNGDPSYFSYVGRWRLDGEHVHHDVAAALYPDWAGTTQTRRIRPQGAEIELIADGVVFQGKAGQGVIRWRRA